MNVAFELIEQNLGMSFEAMFVIVFLVIGGLVFLAKDFQLGLMIMFFLSGCTFAWFYYADYNYLPALMVMLLDFTFMCLSLYATYKSVNRGGVI